MRATLDHLLWRFATWYRDPAVLREASGGLLGEIAAAVGAPHTSGAPAVTVYGGHDVTILPLLMALGHFSTPEDAAWPPYASALCFEEVEPCSDAWAGEARGLLDTLEAAKPVVTGSGDDDGDAWQHAFERRHTAEICVGTGDDGAPQEWLGAPFWEPFRRLTGERVLCVGTMAAHLAEALALPVHNASGPARGGAWVRAVLNFQPVTVFGQSALRTQDFCDRVDGLFGGGGGTGGIGE